MNQPVLPRWRGFNLHQMFTTSARWAETTPMDNHRISEDDFRWMSDWGFDFARVPLSYLFLIGDSERRVLPEERLEIIDRVVEWGGTYGVHVSLNLWRAPGHTNFGYPYNEPEPGTLWTADPYDSLGLFCHMWQTLAARYAGISSDRLSFDLVNEPPATALVPELTDDDILRVYRAGVEAIRASDAGRLIFVEGLDWAYTPAPADWSRDPGVAQSLHSFAPLAVSHYRCDYIPQEMRWNDPVPQWPMPVDRDISYVPEPARSMLERRGGGGVRRWDRDALRDSLRPWLDLAASGVGVHAGETGAHSEVPHQVVLDWLDDMLSILTEHGIGYALWNFRGPFGVLDSNRRDVAYEDWRGHRLDSALLNLLRKY